MSDNRMTGPDDRMTRHPSSVNGPDDRMTPSKRVIRPVLVGKGDPNLGVTPFSQTLVCTGPKTALRAPLPRSRPTSRRMARQCVPAARRRTNADECVLGVGSGRVGGTGLL